MTDGLSLVSVVLDLYARLTLGRNIGFVPAQRRLVLTGPYRVVRHPIYSGWFLMVFAVPVMTLTQFVFAATSSVYLLIAIPFEERSLRRSSSGAYDRYMREVPWKLVPKVF